MRKKRLKRALTLVLAGLMILSSVPLAFAQEAATTTAAKEAGTGKCRSNGYLY